MDRMRGSGSMPALPRSQVPGASPPGPGPGALRAGIRRLRSGRGRRGTACLGRPGRGGRSQPRRLWGARSPGRPA